MLQFLLLLIPAISNAKTTYLCTAQFGELVPIRSLVLKKNKQCQTCLNPKTNIANHLLDQKLSKDYNLVYKKNTNQKPKLKRRLIQEKPRSVFLETRYAYHKKQSFYLTVTCPKPNLPCSGYLQKTLNSPKLDYYEKLNLPLPAKLFDQRTNAKAFATIQLGKRGSLGTIVRVYKQDVLLKQIATPVSASGEIKIRQELNRFTHDTGADEHLEVLPKLLYRVAAIELKIDCQKK